MAVVLTEARALIWSTLRLAEVIGEALREAFLRALLDVPFCLHPDNRNKSRPYLAGRGRLPWANAGSVPVRTRQNVIMLFPSFDLITMLSHNAKKYDAEAVDRLDGPRHQGTASRLMRAADAKKG
jgi:methylaspartate mutase epsilon subunit